MKTQNPRRIISFAKIALTLSVSSCVTSSPELALVSPLKLHDASCLVSDIKTTNDMALIVCSIKNASDSIQSVQLNPEFSKTDLLSSPSESEVNILKSDLEKNGLILPNGTATANGDRPETFIFTALITILSATSKAEDSSEFLSYSSKEIEPGRIENFSFLVKKKTKELPNSINLKFKKPSLETVSVPLNRDTAMETRRRISQ